MNGSPHILGLGCTAVDDLLYLDAYPAADTKAPVRSPAAVRRPDAYGPGGRLAAGLRCGYAGMLGDDELSRFVVARLLEEGIDVAHICRRPDARPIRSTIIVDRGRRTRTILYELGKMLGADPSWPPEDVIRAGEGAGGGPFRHGGDDPGCGSPVTQESPSLPISRDGDDPLFPTLLALVDHLILSRDFALKITGQAMRRRLHSRSGHPSAEWWR